MFFPKVADMSWHPVLRQLSRLFLVSTCSLCQRPSSDVVCSNCHRQLLSCQWKGSVKSDPMPLLGTSASSNILSVLPWGQYRGLLKQALTRLKYDHQDELGFWLGCQLGQRWSHQTYPPGAVVIPIPLHGQRLKERGYNQSALIAKGFCRVAGLPLAEHGLVRVKDTAAMHSLSAQARQQNLTNAFRLGQKLPPRGRSILLLDDIYTTGSTIQAAAITLLQAGYKVHCVMAVARAVFSSP